MALILAHPSCLTPGPLSTMVERGSPSGAGGAAGVGSRDAVNVQ